MIFNIKSNGKEASFDVPKGSFVKFFDEDSTLLGGAYCDLSEGIEDYRGLSEKEFIEKYLKNYKKDSEE